MTIHPRHVGCDISKEFLDVFDPADGAVRRIVNDALSASRWAATIAGAPAIVVLEATGPYDLVLRDALTAAGVAFVRVNPRRARCFAEAAGLLAKTDAVDARMLAAFGAALALPPDAPADPARKALADLAARRDQLVQVRADEKKRRHDAPAAAVRSIDEHLIWLDAAIGRLDADIAALIRDAGALREQAGRLRSAPGVGDVTAVILLAQLPELGAVGPKQIAALAGLAPVANDSGAFRGARRIKGGRRRVRQALYMAALAAIRCSPRLKAYYLSVLGRAKAAKVALIAVARKLLTILNAMIRDNAHYA